MAVTTPVKPAAKAGAAAAPKAPPIADYVKPGPIVATGVVIKLPSPVDELKLVVLDSNGNAVAETTRPVTDPSLAQLNYPDSLVSNPSDKVYFLTVKGYNKGSLAWEQLLGRKQFKS